jgi:hypothetical protein
MDEKPVYLVTDFAIFNRSNNLNRSKIFLFYPSEIFKFPILITKSDSKASELENFYKMKAAMKKHKIHRTNLFEILKTDDQQNISVEKFMENQKCSNEKVDVKRFVVNSSESFCIVLTAYHIQQTSFSINSISKNLIFLMDQNFNQSAENFDVRNFIRENLEFSEFDEKGFCICDELLNYINECSYDENAHCFNFFLIIGLIILFYVISEIFT